MLEWLGLIPLLGLTGNWRGYRMGGKAIGDHNMSTDLKKKFEAARASGNMDQARAIADKAQEAKDKRKAEKAKTIAPEKAKNIDIKVAGKEISVPPGAEIVVAMSQPPVGSMYRVMAKGSNDYIREKAQGNYMPTLQFKTAQAAQNYADKINKAMAKTAKQEEKKSPPKKANDPIDGFNVAKKLGIKGVRKSNKPDVIRQKIELHIAGDNAVRYLKAGANSGLPQYKGVSESAVRDFAQNVHNSKFSISQNMRTFNARGMGESTTSQFVANGILRPGNDKYIHELTPLGRELAKNVITDLDNGRVKKQADRLYAGLE